jgi:bacteriocin-like protein
VFDLVGATPAFSASIAPFAAPEHWRTNMNAKFQTLSADELNQVSGGFSFHISFLDVITGGLDRLVDNVHTTVNNKVTDTGDNEKHAVDSANGTLEGDPSDTGNVSGRDSGAPFPESD